MARAIYSLLLISLIGLSLSTVCRDGSNCPGTTTCCLTPSGVGCCPYENAECCGDGLHCCPQGYKCFNGGCNKTLGDQFSVFLSSNPAKTEYTLLTPSTPAPVVAKSTIVNANLSSPSINNIIKCVEDIKPVAKVVIEIVNQIKAGNTQAALELITKLVAEGTTLVFDCAKIIETEKPSSSSLVYLDLDTPSIDDIFKCISDLQPIVSTIIEIVNDIKGGDTSAALKIIPQLILEGTTLATDCYKLIKDL
jgi:hypothetical protein